MECVNIISSLPRLYHYNDGVHVDGFLTYPPTAVEANGVRRDELLTPPPTAIQANGGNDDYFPPPPPIVRIQTELSA